VVTSLNAKTTLKEKDLAPGETGKGKSKDK
jgi:hypothetical protein